MSTETERPTCAWPTGCDRTAARRDYKQRKFCAYHLDNARSTYNAVVPTVVSEEWLPVKPLLDFVQARGGFGDLWYAAGLDEGTAGNRRERDRIDRNIARARKRGAMRFDQIDEICCRLLGLHPAEIYGEVWWVEATRPRTWRHEGGR